VLSASVIEECHHLVQHVFLMPQQQVPASRDAPPRPGVPIGPPCACPNSRPSQDGVSVVAAADARDPQTIRARYVVGADGMNSTVREHAGIGFTGDKYEQSFLLADVRITWPLAGDEVLLFFPPEGLVVVAALPHGVHRVVATVDDAPEHPGIGDVQQLLDTRGPAAGSSRVHEIIWGSRFRVHHRLADHYRAGRILLAGDAAHVHSPAGGQGMNTGIQDGVALGHALAALLAGRADERALDQYERTRRPVAQRVVALTDRMTRVATLRQRRSRAVRNAMIGMVGHVPPVVRKLATELAGLRNREAVA